LEATQFLPRPREELFEFFGDALNLETITPPWLTFKVASPTPLQIGPQSVIEYRLRVHGIPLRWKSLISLWEPPGRFVDEQLRGPYRRWHHEHVLEAVEGGTLCHDIVDYEVPGGWLVHKLFIARDLRTIFGYRQKRLEELFGASNR
jgi:ligand-binding SRPBCC domain-containing protein